MNQRSRAIIENIEAGWSPQLSARKAGVPYKSYLTMLKSDEILREVHNKAVKSTTAKRRSCR